MRTTNVAPKVRDMEPPIDPFDTLVGRLLERRIQLDLTQIELADRLGVSRRSIQNWESGKRQPQPGHRRLIRDFLSRHKEPTT